jgi:aspartate aminotransferase-like enzyme
MRKFNAGEINDAAEFNAAMEDSRQKFYAEMQFQIDTANAKWRQTVATSNTAMQFEAAAADVKAILDISQEGLNRTWDRADAMMDYLFKGAATQEEFELRLLLAQMQAQAGAGGGSSFLGDIFKIVSTKWLLG